MTTSAHPKDDQELVIARVARHSLIKFQRDEDSSLVFDDGQLFDGGRCFVLSAEACIALIGEISGLDH
jgi:hypothetical protein